MNCRETTDTLRHVLTRGASAVEGIIRTDWNFVQQ